MCAEIRQLNYCPAYVCTLVISLHGVRSNWLLVGLGWPSLGAAAGVAL